jgi:sensory rhodopsin
MITVELIQVVFAVLYGLVTVGLLGLTTRVPDRLRRYAAILLAVVVTAALDLVAQLFGVGSVAVGSGSLGVSTLFSQTVEYVVLYGVVVRLGGGSRRLAAVMIAVAMLPVYVTEVGGILAGEVLLLALVAVGFVLPFPILLYFFFGRLKRLSATLPPRRRLLYWKARNLILFVYAMVLVYIGLILSGVLTDQVLSQLLLQYVGFVFSAGLPAFFLYKFTGFDEESETLLFETGPERSRATDGEATGATAD